MARSISYWYSVLIDEKNNQVVIKDDLVPDSSTIENLQGLLAQLSSNSKVAIWRLLLFIAAVGYWILDNFWDSSKADMQAIADSANYGNDAWWLDKAIEFQYGDDLLILTSASGQKYIGYSPIKDAIDESRVVKLASISSTNGSAFLKVAYLDGTDIIKLTTEQLAAFKTYVDRIQPTGTFITAISENPDLLRLKLKIYYNGLYDLTAFKLSIQAAINSYLVVINAGLSGKIDINRLTDAIQAVPGFTSMEPVLAYAKSQVSGSVYVQFTRIYNTYAGYAMIDPDYPLDGEDPDLLLPVIEYVAE